MTGNKKVSLTSSVLLVFAALLACKSSPPAEAKVSCHYAGAFQCQIAMTGETGRSYNVCWDIDVSCVNGEKLAASTCMEMSGNGNASSTVPNDKFTGGKCNVTQVTGVAVNNVKITKRN